MRFWSSKGVRSRIFLYFLLFTALLLALLWLFQIVFLNEFYLYQKKYSLRTSAESIVRNIDNENLQTLIERIAEEENICILVTDDGMREMHKAEAWKGCIIHRMSRHDLRRHTMPLEEGVDRVVAEFPLMGFRNQQYDAEKFLGRVPPRDPGDARSMIMVQRAQMKNGTDVYVFLNTLITPVASTVQTIRNELYFITGILIVLSFLISLVLSRHITRPIEEMTAAAAALSHGSYTPVNNIGYREIDQLNQQLCRTASDLNRVETMQRELMANISHDLRTPLTLIEGYAEAMRDLPDENTPENMQVIIDETRRLSTLVNSVLELSRTRDGREDLQLQRFCLTDQIRGILHRYTKLTQQDGYRIVFAPDEDVWVCADEVKVQQVIYNLINNALTYTGEDKTVTVLQILCADKVRIEICDSGEGIAPEDMEHIWDRYYRGSKPHKRAAIGSGLGLSIVKNILQAHGLDYGVKSAEGAGSVFWFELSRE